MKIIGEQYLKDNSYKMINIDTHEITIQGNDSISMFTDNPIVDELKGLSSELQVSKIIDYFINNNSVGGIIYGHGPTEHERNIIVTTEDKPLVIDIPISKEDSEKIFNKYKNDRLKALNRKKYSEYVLSSKYVCTSVYKVSEDGIEFSLSHKKTMQELHDSELLFLIELLGTLFKDEIIFINSKYETINNNKVFKGIYLESKDSNKKIKLENLSYYKQTLLVIIFNHNCDVKQNRKNNKQLKMKGF